MIFILYIACVKKYFEEKERDKEDSDSESDDDDVIYKGYKTVLDSKSSDEALVSHLKSKSLFEIRLNSWLTSLNIYLLTLIYNLFTENLKDYTYIKRKKYILKRRIELSSQLESKSISNPLQNLLQNRVNYAVVNKHKNITAYIVMNFLFVHNCIVHSILQWSWKCFKTLNYNGLVGGYFAL